MSTAFIQSKLRGVAYAPRIIYSDCENNLERIDLIHSIQIAYWRGMITRKQVQAISAFIEEEDIAYIENFYCTSDELSAALRAVAEISGYTDESWLQMYQELDTTNTAQTRLTELSNEFTVSLVRPDTAENQLLEC